jgi:predicted permease
MSLTWENRADRVYGQVVSGNYFDVLGVAMAAGRGFTAEEDRSPGTHAVTVISHPLWQRRFGGAPTIVGAQVLVNGKPFTVIGVTNERFQGSVVGLQADLWVPLMMDATINLGSTRLDARGSRSFQGMGRLAPGVPLQQADLEIAGIAAQLEQEFPDSNAGRSAGVLPMWKAPFGATFVLGPVLGALSALVGLVLLIACANVANLLLSRAVARRKEIAIRLSLGASRVRLVRQLLTESLVLGSLAGVLSLAITYWTSGLLMSFLPTTDFPIKLVLGVDPWIVAFTASLGLITGAIFGIAPALQASSPDVVPALKDESLRGTGAPSRSRLRNGLVVAQVAFSILLLIAAGLFVVSLQRAQTMSPGFNPDHVAVASYDLLPNGYTIERARVFHEALLKRAATWPGVRAATMTRRLPLGFSGTSSTTIRIDDYEPKPNEEMGVQYVNVGPDYFATMEIPVVRGREFTFADAGEMSGVAAINETMARRFWAGRDPIGQRIHLGSSDAQVVAVAKDSKYQQIGEKPRSFMYLPILQSARRDATIVLRTSGDPAAILPTIRRAVHDLDANLPLYEMKTMRDQLGMATLTHRMAATLLGVFGILALTLASIGLYSVIAYAVSQRTREIGIRMALGARPRDLLAMVVAQGMRVTLIGVVLGVVGAAGVMRLLANQLFGVSPTDPAIFGGVCALLGAVALAATWMPARRASRIDPMMALRCE